MKMLDRMPEMLEGSIPVDETVFLNELEEGDMLDLRWKQEDLHVSAIHSRKANMKCDAVICRRRLTVSSRCRWCETAGSSRRSVRDEPVR